MQKEPGTPCRARGKEAMTDIRAALNGLMANGKKPLLAKDRGNKTKLTINRSNYVNGRKIIFLSSYHDTNNKKSHLQKVLGN